MSFARALIAKAHTTKLLILCTRRYQVSILDSVHRVIASQIYDLGLQDWFDIQKNTIVCKTTGSEFIFKGLQHIDEIRSLQGVNICWIEEAHSLEDDLYRLLDPTLRDESEMWISFNPYEIDDPSYIRWVLKPPENAIVEKVNWNSNPWFPPELELLRKQDLVNDPENYMWTWEGETRQQSEAAVYHGKVLIKNFEAPPEKTQFYHGLDFGFGPDPTVLLRCWIKSPSEEGFGEDLMIDREAYGHHINLDEMPNFFENSVETSHTWPIRADAANPMQISYLARQGLSVTAAEKWQGSVEDGIAHLRAFRKIIIHERLCPNTKREFLLYRYKTDKRALDEHGRPLILPILEDKNDHSPDAARYALDSMI